METEQESSDPCDKDLHLQTDAALRAKLKKSKAKAKSLRAELERSIAATSLLDSTVREREQLIHQLSRENAHHESEIQRLESEILQKSARIASLHSGISSKDQEIDSVTEQHSALRSAIEKLGAQLSAYEGIEQRLLAEQQRADALRSELARLGECLKAKESELAAYRSDILSGRQSAVSLLLTFPAAPADEGRVGGHTAASAIEIVREQLQALKGQPSASEALTYIRQRKKLAEFRAATLKEFAEKNATLRAESRSLIELSGAVESEQANLETESAAYSARLAEYRTAQRLFEAFVKREIALGAAFDADSAELARLRDALQEKKAILAEQIEKLEAGRQAHATEFASLQSVRWQIEELKSKSQGYSSRLALYRQQLSAFESGQLEFERERTEGHEILALRSEIKREHAAMQKQIEALAVNHASAVDPEKEAEDIRLQSEQLHDRETKLEKHFAQLAAAQAELAGRFSKLSNEQREVDEERAKSVQQAPRQDSQGDRAYLKRICLQFFFQEGSRESLIPVLLRVLQCSDEEVQVVLRKWNDSHQLVSRSLWPF
jgi:chromosome segregation ATPase